MHLSNHSNASYNSRAYHLTQKNCGHNRYTGSYIWSALLQGVKLRVDTCRIPTPGMLQLRVEFHCDPPKGF